MPKGSEASVSLRSLCEDLASMQSEASSMQARPTVPMYATPYRASTSRLNALRSYLYGLPLTKPQPTLDLTRCR